MNRLLQLMDESPIPEDDRLKNLALFLPSDALATMITMYELYKLILNVPGVIIEFGCRYGRNLATLASLRRFMEPVTRRRVVGFDSFQGLTGIGEKDGDTFNVTPNRYACPDGYREFLCDLLGARYGDEYFGIIAGDASETVKLYFQTRPHTVVSLAYFDFDIYAPTKACLELLKDHIVKGSVLAFDNFAWELFPGETVAVMESIGIFHRFRRFPWSDEMAYMVVE